MDKSGEPFIHNEPLDLPERIKFLHSQYKIIVLESAKADELGLDGQMCFAEQEIHIDEKLVKSEKVRVIFHELGHAIARHYSLELGQKEERVVESFGVALATIFLDNPDLYHWMGRMLYGENRNPQHVEEGL